MSPAVLILGAVAHREKHAGGWQALQEDLSSRACVSASIQCRFSQTISTGCT